MRPLSFRFSVNESYHLGLVTVGAWEEWGGWHVVMIASVCNLLRLLLTILRQSMELSLRAVLVYLAGMIGEGTTRVTGGVTI